MKIDYKIKIIIKYITLLLLLDELCQKHRCMISVSNVARFEIHLLDIGIWFLSKICFEKRKYKFVLINSYIS